MKFLISPQIFYNRRKLIYVKQIIVIVFYNFLKLSIIYIIYTINFTILILQENSNSKNSKFKNCNYLKNVIINYLFSNDIPNIEKDLEKIETYVLFYMYVLFSFFN